MLFQYIFNRGLIYNGWRTRQLMPTWTDGRVIENSSVAATTETQIGSTIQVPNNQNWLVHSLYWAHAGDGTGRVAVGSLPGMNGVYPVNSNDPTSMGTNAGSAGPHAANFVINGPNTIDAYITPDSSSSTVGQFYMRYTVHQTNTQTGI